MAAGLMRVARDRQTSDDGSVVVGDETAASRSRLTAVGTYALGDAPPGSVFRSQSPGSRPMTRRGRRALRVRRSRGADPEVIDDHPVAASAGVAGGGE